MSLEQVRTRLGEPVANLWMRFDRELFALSPRASRLLAVLVMAASALLGLLMLRAASALFVMPAVAQSGSGASDVSSVLCGPDTPPIGELIAFAVAALSIFLLAKAVIQGTVAFNKLGSSRAQQQFEGKQALAGAGKTAAGAIVPPVFVAILNSVLGLQLQNCIFAGLQDGNIFAVVATLPF
ncbi:hypothetical protein [Halorientalis halophila]|uniref:hypothetical protein n=1 Tax=Halorientalis halophila TaxID=3108499 RepID=UPI0030098D32